MQVQFKTEHEFDEHGEGEEHQHDKTKSPITNCPVFRQLRTNKVFYTNERLKAPFIN